MTSGLPDTRTEAPDTPRGLLNPYTDLDTPPRKKPKRPKPLRWKTHEVITRDTGQNEEAEEVEQEEAAEDMTEVESRSNSYVPDIPLRISPRLSRGTRNTYMVSHMVRRPMVRGRQRELHWKLEECSGRRKQDTMD
jgi:hypothetical protein